MNEIKHAIENLEYIKGTEIPYGRLWKTCDTAISALTEKLNGGWISVKDALPTIPIEKINDGYNRIAVLVTSKNQDMAIIHWYDIEDQLFYDDFGFFGNVDEDVITWQPLPQPYKEVLE